MSDEATFIRHEPCPGCGSRDNLARYSDGHAYCFSCEHYEPGEGQPDTTKRRKRVKGLITSGEVKPLLARKITEETCRHFGYQKATYQGKAVQVAPYYDEDGNLVAQHLRFKNKDDGFPWLGKPKEAMPFGFRRGSRRDGRMIVVTEGEIDAMSMSQVLDNKFPIVSIGCGAGPQMRKYAARHRGFFNGFERIIVMFDSDEPGQNASEIFAEVVGPKCEIVTLPLKDPNEMLVEDRIEELIKAQWNGRKWRPQGVVELRDLIDDIRKPIEWGWDWPYKTLSDLTYGRRLGEVYAFGAGTGTGKTDVLTEVIEHTLMTLKHPVAAFMFEQQPRETALRLAGKVAGWPLHIPPERGNEEAEKLHAERLDAASEQLANGTCAPFFLYDHFGSSDYDSVEDTIRYLANAEDVKHFFIDHLTAFAAEAEDERKELESTMARIGKLVKELDIIIYLVSHLATPEGKPHEEGGRVMVRHFKGSRAIGFWCHYMFGLERNQQAENIVERTTTTFRVLKDRYTGRANGEVFYLRYDYETARLNECDPPAAESPFDDEVERPSKPVADSNTDF